MLFPGPLCPQQLSAETMAGHRDPALHWKMGCLCKNFTHPSILVRKTIYVIYEILAYLGMSLEKKMTVRLYGRN